MQVGDLVILEYKGVDLKEKDRLKIGSVKTTSNTTLQLAKVLRSNGDQTWCYPVQLEAVKKCP